MLLPFNYMRVANLRRVLFNEVVDRDWLLPLALSQLVAGGGGIA